jgi:hypothetical protein
MFSCFLFLGKILPSLKQFVLVGYRHVRVSVQERRNKSVATSWVTNKQKKDSDVTRDTTRRLVFMLRLLNVFVEFPLMLSVSLQALHIAN